MRIFLKRTQAGFEPDTEYDSDDISRIKFGSVVEAEIKQPMNLKFHRKWRALLRFAFENQDKYQDFEDFYIEIKLKTGHYDEHVTTKGNLIYVPKSMSFSKCDEIEFDQRYSKAIDVIIEHFMPDSTAEEIDRIILNILDFS